MPEYSILHQNESLTDLSTDDGLEKKANATCLDRSYQRHSSLKLAWMIHAVMALINVCFLTWTLSRPAVFGTAVSTTLLRNFGSEPRKFEFYGIYLPDGSLSPRLTNNLTGPPRAALNSAWRELQKYSDILVSNDELGPLANDPTVVRATDGSGSYSMLAVYHGLHCVERLHHVLYTDHYYPNMTSSEVFLLKQHTEHCLDYLRQYIQCNADTTIIPMHWAGDSLKPTPVDNGDHQCVDWDQLERWGREHSFNPRKTGLLVHPHLGDPYVSDPDGKHLNLGVSGGE
ncbi:hypothetical protein B0T14DRAFT_604523 [Immersiella caudata]|uniref:Tat pathway signal sequence n=1 Tax=Immersiella caudata TaxID=314043 RepID=A0AA39WIU1_9PEZI|nr:hypothetical protein B0T14DRAFT_604523 [Immersiella caudata]